MDFNKLVGDAAASYTHPDKPSQEPHDSNAPPSSTQLFSSAKVVAGAAQSALHNETDKLDKGKVAGAASDLLGAASHYGKLQEKGFGQYVEKAEDYLHQYHSSQSTTTAAPAHPSSTDHPPSSTDHKPESESGDGAASESGYGEYVKMAQGFLKKN